MEPGSERRLAAILSGDVVGYSRLMAADEDTAVRLVTAYREEIELLVNQHRGRLVDFHGDDFLAEFASALAAVHCALQIQDVIQARNARLPEERRMEFRLGIHQGDVRFEGERIFGTGVNVAARLQALAEPGGICISGAVREELRNRLDEPLEDLGEQSVKNIPEPVHAFRLRQRASEAPAPHARGVSRARVVLASAALAAITVVAVAYFTLDERTPPSAGAPLTRIAVLPFDDLSPGGDHAWLAKAVAQELTDKLTRSEALQVVASTVAHDARQKAADIREVGELLGVGSVVGGQVRRSGDDLRISAQLIRVADGYQIWSGSYERRAEDVIVIQEEIAEALRAELGVEADTYSWLRRARYKPRDPRAFELMKKGVELEQTYTEEGFRAAIDYTLRALEIDPNYAQAHAQVAYAHYNLWLFRFDRSEENLAKARASGARALANDEANGSAHLLMAMFSMDEWDWKGAEDRLRRAIELNPGQGSLRWGYGMLLMRTGREQEGLVQQRLFAELNPGTTVYTLGLAYVYAGELAAGIEIMEHARDTVPNSILLHESIATAYHLSGNDDAALTALLYDAPSDLKTVARTGYEQQGWKGGVERTLQWLAVQSGSACTDDPATGIHLLAWLGEADALFECADEAIEEKSLLFYKANPIFDPYRDDPRFTAVLRRMNLEP